MASIKPNRKGNRPDGDLTGYTVYYRSSAGKSQEKVFGLRSYKGVAADARDPAKS